MKIEQYCQEKGYSINRNGDIINAKGIIINGYIGSTGRKRISFRINKKHASCQVHRLQAYQKYSNKLYKEGIEVRHLNGDCLDNSYDNIEIGTHYQNIMDIPADIRMKRAIYAGSFAGKYNKEEVKAFYKNNNSYKITMKKFNISSKGTLHYILNN